MKNIHLCALEEDALSEDVAAKYNESGVPLSIQRIFLRLLMSGMIVPVAEWLKAIRRSQWLRALMDFIPSGTGVDKSHCYGGWHV
jgi:hypothetical protein